jgi:zinc/manganese transport system substrate-binding protein
LAQADLVVVNGLALEGWIDRLVSVSGYRGPIAVAAKGVKPRVPAGTGNTAEAVDPHAWNSADNGAIYAANIAAALVAADPAHAADYRQRGARYAAELHQLDGWAHGLVAAVPADKRKIITSHDALGYLADAYGIEVHAPVGFSTAAEPSAAEIAALIAQIRREHIRAVFIENASDPRLVQEIARETGAALGGTLYPEALSEPTGPAPSYTRLFRHNIATICAGMRQN